MEKLHAIFWLFSLKYLLQNMCHFHCHIKICYKEKLLDSKKCLWIRTLWLIFHFLTFQNSLGFPCLTLFLYASLTGLIAKLLLNLFLGMRLVINSLKDFHFHKDALGRKYHKELYIPLKVPSSVSSLFLLLFTRRSYICKRSHLSPYNTILE